MLEVDNVSAGYGKSIVLADVSLVINPGEAVTVLGPNGAGKSTLLKVIMGLLPVRQGEIRFQGKRLNGLSTAATVHRGVVLCPEGRNLFANMSVKDNLLLGAYLRRGRSDIKQDINRIGEMFPVVGRKLHVASGLLSGGEQQMVAIGRALMGRPEVLLLDEPSLGIAPLVVEGIAHEMRAIRDSGVSLLLVEQNARIALDIADRGYVLESGRIVLEGPANELAGSDRVRAAYFGVT